MGSLKDESGIEFVWSEPQSIGLGFARRPVREYSGDALKERLRLDLRGDVYVNWVRGNA